MAGATTAVLAIMLAGAAAVSPSLKGSKADSSNGLKRSKITIGVPLVQHHMTVCNAYHSTAPLEITHVDQHISLTKDKPLKYKECQEFTLPLGEGNRLDFKSNGQDVGTFHATSMPKASTSLLLIPRHREGSSRALAFDSHAFADLKSPQIAVVDAYHGKQATTVNIIENLDETEAGQTPLAEALRYNSVVAVAPGKYNVALLESGATSNFTAMPLHAGTRSKCVVMRVGGGIHDGVAFPQELVVFPNSAFRQFASASILMVAAFLLFASN